MVNFSGVNLRTGQQGIFPSAYAVDMDYSDFDPANTKVKRERYLLGYVNFFIKLGITLETYELLLIYKSH